MKCRELHTSDDVCAVCLGTGVAKYIPVPESLYDEIIPNLFQGGAEAVIDQEFDAVFSLHTRRGIGPGHGVYHSHMDIPDGALSPWQFADVVSMANNVALMVGDGKRTLVRCQAGLNRSGLVVALAMVNLGYPKMGALRLIRHKRSPWALCNDSFVQLFLENA